MGGGIAERGRECGTETAVDMRGYSVEVDKFEADKGWEREKLSRVFENGFVADGGLNEANRAEVGGSEGMG